MFILILNFILEFHTSLLSFEIENVLSFLHIKDTHMKYDNRMKNQCE